MRVSESQLRRIIREELQRESLGPLSALASFLGMGGGSSRAPTRGRGSVASEVVAAMGRDDARELLRRWSSDDPSAFEELARAVGDALGNEADEEFIDGVASAMGRLVSESRSGT